MRDPAALRKSQPVDPIGTALVTLRVARQNLAALAAHVENDDHAFRLLFNIRQSLSFLIEAMAEKQHQAAQELTVFFEQISMNIALEFIDNGRNFSQEDRALAEVEALIAGLFS